MANLLLGTSVWPPLGMDLGMDLGSHRDEHHLHSGLRAFIPERSHCMERAAFMWECRSGFGIITACAQSLDPKSKFQAHYLILTISSYQVALGED
jgi:hypothetical protein